MTKKSILLVDDHPSVGEGTKSMIEQEVGLQVTITLSALEALQLAKQQSFDLYVFDLHMPEMSGTELTKHVITLYPEAVVLIYSGYDIVPHFNYLVEAGISGFISKTSSKEQLIRTIYCALQGETIVPTKLFKQLRRQPTVLQPNSSSPIQFAISEREQHILLEIVRGKSNKELAHLLHLSTRSIEYTITNLFTKFGVNSRVELIDKAKEYALIPEQEFE